MSSTKISGLITFLKMRGKSFLKKNIQFDSSRYWEKRYKSGGNSGPGSYSDLAAFKAKVINGFVKNNNITGVIEFGCGDGNQLSLSNYDSYIGLDVSLKAINISKNKFSRDKTKSFFLYHPTCFVDSESLFQRELALSLDVIFHLTEDQVFHKYLHDLFNTASKFVIIYSSNFNHQNIRHVRHREFTVWISKFITGWKLFQIIKNDYPYKSEDPNNTSYSDFFIYVKE